MVGEGSHDDVRETVVRTTEGDSKAFNVKVGLYQGPVLSLLPYCWMQMEDVIQQ